VSVNLSVVIPAYRELMGKTFNLLIRWRHRGGR
jgi:hypothetical protein